MSPRFAALTRQQLPVLQKRMQSLGKLQSLSFAGVDLQGMDVFDATFEQGAMVLGILLDASGKMTGGTMRPGTSGPRPAVAP